MALAKCYTFFHIRDPLTCGSDNIYAAHRLMSIIQAKLNVVYNTEQTQKTTE